VQGTGLGLAIARRIVRDHGGELVYLPRPGGGSIFQVELP
jgi:signal transduction histidine kinase